MGLEILWMWEYVLGTSIVGMLFNLMLLMIIGLGFGLVFLLQNIGVGALMEISKVSKKSQCLVLLKPYNIWLAGQIIDDVVHFRYGGVDYAFYINQKDIERMFNGKNFVEIYATELVGMNTQVVTELTELAKQCSEEELKMYIENVKEHADAMQILKNIKPEYREEYAKYTNSLQEKIHKFENKYDYILKFNPKEKQIGFFQPKWEKLKQYYINGSLSMFHQLAKSYGIAMKSKEKPDYMMIGIMCFMLLMGAGLAYKFMSG
jgi:hypothetical protein